MIKKEVKLMANITRKLIEYQGITSPVPSLAGPLTPFKQFNVQETLQIPEAKPDIEQIVTVKADLDIIKTTLIKTPSGVVSLDGQKLTGWKLAVEGHIRQTVQYVANEPLQSVHAAHFTVPFSTYVILPPDFIEGSLTDVKGYIEDIYAERLDARRIFKNITILLVARVIE
jgi:hypothetical protein